jgi:hypothetical protein
VCIASGIDAGSNVNDILEPTKQLPDGNGFACDSKSLQLIAVIGGGHMGTTTMVLFGKTSGLRVLYRDGGVTITKFNFNLKKVITIF